jgi:uncharacterized repeat protein (TIGR01451 family)
VVRATDDGAPTLFDDETVTITVTNVNEPPVVTNDAYTTDEDTPLSIAAPGVLGNDLDPEVAPLTVQSASAVSALGATVALAADGSFSYDPRSSATLQALGAGAQATDSFSYTAIDGGGATAGGSVTVTVDGAAVNLSLTKQALVPGGQVPLGAELTFQLSVANDPAGLATGIVVTDPLPIGLAFASSGCATEAAGVVTWAVGDLAAGASASCDFNVTANDPGTFVNVATLASDDLAAGSEPTAERGR